MGVQGLWQLLLPAARRVALEALDGKVLAVDASIWIVQFASIQKDQEDDSDGLGRGHHVGFLRRILKLLFHKIFPVFVFDGATPEIKLKTTRKRKFARDSKRLDVRKLMKLPLLAQVATVTTTATAGKMLPSQQKTVPATLKGSGRGQDEEVEWEAEDVDEIEDAEGVGAAPSRGAKEQPWSSQPQTSSSQLANFRSLDGLNLEEIATFSHDIRKEIVEEVRLVELQKKRKSYRSIEANPELYSQNQLANFFKSSQLNQKLHKIQTMASALDTESASSSAPLTDGTEPISSTLHSQPEPQQQQKQLQNEEFGNGRESPQGWFVPPVGTTVNVSGGVGGERADGLDRDSEEDIEWEEEERDEDEGEDQNEDNAKLEEDEEEVEVVEKEKEKEKDKVDPASSAHDVFSSAANHRFGSNAPWISYTLSFPKSDTDTDFDILPRAISEPSSSSYDAVLRNDNEAEEVEEEEDENDDDDDDEDEDEDTNSRSNLDGRSEGQSSSRQAEREAPSFKFSDSEFDHMKLDLIMLLNAFDLPYVVAPFEAEAQCAYLEQMELVDGIISDDSDCFLFGAKTVFRQFFNEKTHVEHYSICDIETRLRLDRQDLVFLSYLLGSDYTPGVKGVGIVNATEILRAFRRPNDDASLLTGLRRFKAWLEGHSFVDAALDEFDDHHKKARLKWAVPESFPDQKVMEEYLGPQVSTDCAHFSWIAPNLAKIGAYCRDKLAWTDVQVQAMIVPILQQLSATSSQPKILQFFAPTDNFVKVASVNSKRLKKSLNSKLDL